MAKTKKYRSAFEADVAAVLPPWYEYEKNSFKYTVPRKYIPDFTDIGNEALSTDVWIEVKGFFRAGDVAKYKAIRAAYPDIRLVFVFSNPNKKVRKGAKLSMGDWAIKNGWEYATIKTISEVL